MVNDTYISPEIYEIEIISEGIICFSGYTPDSDNSELYYMYH